MWVYVTRKNKEIIKFFKTKSELSLRNGQSLMTKTNFKVGVITIKRHLIEYGFSWSSSKLKHWQKTTCKVVWNCKYLEFDNLNWWIVFLVLVSPKEIFVYPQTSCNSASTPNKNQRYELCRQYSRLLHIILFYWQFQCTKFAVQDSRYTKIGHKEPVLFLLIQMSNTNLWFHKKMLFFRRYT